MKALLFTLLLGAAAGVLPKDGGGTNKIFDLPSDNLGAAQPNQPPLSYGPPIPPPEPSQPSPSYGPPQPAPGTSSYSYIHQPPPQPYVPPPPAPMEYDYQPPSSYGHALSILEDDCGYWKALSAVLLAGVVAIGLAFVLQSFPLNLTFLNGEELGPKLSDPDFISSVYDQINDISRVLMAIKDASTTPSEE